MIDIIPMTEQHVVAVSELEKVCFSVPWSLNAITSELNNPLSFWLVAVEDGCLLGYIGSQSVMDESNVMNVAVDPSSRRRGVAERLVCSLIDSLRSKGIASLTLEVRASNLPAISLYEKLEFCQVGRRPGYYRHPKEDALIMRKEW